MLNPKKQNSNKNKSGKEKSGWQFLDMRFCFQKNKTSENKNAAAFFVFSDVIQLKKKHSGGSAARPRAALQRMGTVLQRRLQSKTWKHTWAWHRLGEHSTVLLRNVWGKCDQKDRKARLANICVPDIGSVSSMS